jgi:HK97 family phage portal protein
VGLLDRIAAAQKQKREFFGIPGAQALIPIRSAQKQGAVTVTNDSAMRHSAVWACLRLRADLISTMPMDVFRRVQGMQVEMPKPPILVNPGGERVDICEWLYSSQVDLDRAGNVIGLITEVNALGLPARIDLQPLGECSVQSRDGVVTYRIGGKSYDPSKVWHERQYTVAGLEVGLSPVAYAAWSIGEYLSIQDFALAWFGGGAVPKARMKNTAKTINNEEAEKVKSRYRATTQNGDLFVYGADWEYDFMQAQNQGVEWIEGKRYGITDIARFFGAPGDLIEAAVSTGTITYANISQRNLQFLIMNLQPAIYRRELRLSKLLPQPRYVKLNTDALLRMDPQTRAQVMATKIASRQMAPSEARELDNLPPFTDSQYAEFDRLFPAKTLTQAPGTPRSLRSVAADWDVDGYEPPIRAIASFPGQPETGVVE